MALEVGDRWSARERVAGRHDAVLLETFESLLTELNLRPQAIDEAVVVNGPGSFTGLRIAVSFLHALDAVKPIRVLAIDQLSLLASVDSRSDQAVLDARMDEVYVGRSLDRYGVFQSLEVVAATAVELSQMTACHADEHDLFKHCLAVRPTLHHVKTLAERQPVDVWTSGAQLVPKYVRHSVNWKPLSEQPSKLYDR